MCTEISLQPFAYEDAEDLVYGGYSSDVSPNLGLGGADFLALQFFGSGYEPTLNGEALGTFDLASNGDENFSTCSRCIRVFQDPGTATKIYFQQSGTLVVSPPNSPTSGSVEATLSDVTLVEVTIDSTTVESTPVPGGECLHITSAVVSVANPLAGWTCSPFFFGDGFCDCGCGTVDSDCADASVASCDFCDVGCDASGTCATIDPNNNAVCTP